MGQITSSTSTRCKTSGFTLVEVLCAVVIIGILTTLFYSTFFSSWKTMDNYSTRAVLWQDMNKIIDDVTLAARRASNINVSGDRSSVDLILDNAVIATCAFDQLGRLTLDQAGAVELISDRVDPLASSFEDRGGALMINLVLADNVSDRRVSIETSTEIYLRNQ